MLFVIFMTQDSGAVQAAGGGEGMGVDYNRFSGACGWGWGGDKPGRVAPSVSQICEPPDVRKWNGFLQKEDKV